MYLTRSNQNTFDRANDKHQSHIHHMKIPNEEITR